MGLIITEALVWLPGWLLRTAIGLPAGLTSSRCLLGRSLQIRTGFLGSLLLAVAQRPIFMRGLATACSHVQSLISVLDFRMWMWVVLMSSTPSFFSPVPIL